MKTNKIILLNNLLKEEIRKYENFTTDELKEKLRIDKNSKNLNRVIFNKIIEISSNKDKLLKLLEECSCVIKTINLEWNNLLKESMSLNVFKYTEIYNESWENSKLYKYFSENTFVFVVFKKELKGSKLENIKVWKMPDNILNSGVKDTWCFTQSLIQSGKIVNYIDNRNRYITYFPTSSETKFIHVRPHAQNRDDTFELPVPDKLTGKTEFMKHSFWLNSNFVKKIVVEDKYYE